MAWVHRTIVVPAAFVEPARAACAGPGGDGMFTTGLSETGELPATHFVSYGLIEEEFAIMLENTDVLSSVATSFGINPEPLIMVVLASDITDPEIESIDAVFSRKGLKIIQ